MKKINVKLSKQGIDNAIARLEKYRDSIEPKAKEVCKRLAESGIPIVDTAYAQAKVDSDSPWGWTTKAFTTEHGAKLQVWGQAVAFWEFGAGVTAGQDYPPEYTGGVDTSPGSWSQSEFGMGQFDIATHPYWHWHGKRYTGLYPSYGMYNASKHIEKTAERELKRAFK